MTKTNKKYLIDDDTIYQEQCKLLPALRQAFLGVK